MATESIHTSKRKITQAGFSLLDVMITLAITAILASIAVPNFERVVHRARQTEAKTNLAIIYTGEKMFNTEWGGYTGDFRDIGVIIQGHLKYDVGFAGPGWMPGGNFVPSESALCGPRMAYNTEVSACALGPGSSQARALFRPAPTNAACGAGQIPTAIQFRATAIGLIGGPIEDIWTLDDSKTLCNNQVGL